MRSLARIIIQVITIVILSHQISQAQSNPSAVLSLNGTRFSIGDTLKLRLRAREGEAKKVRPFLSLRIPGGRVFYLPDFTTIRPDMPVMEIPYIPATEIFQIRFSEDTIIPGTSVHLPAGNYLWNLELLSPDSDVLIDASLASFSLNLGPSIRVFANGTRFDDRDDVKLGISLHKGSSKFKVQSSKTIEDPEVKAELSVEIGPISVFFKPDLSLTPFRTLIGPFPAMDASIDNFFSFTALDSFPGGIYTLRGRLFTAGENLINESTWSFSIGKGTLSGKIVTATEDDLKTYEVKIFSMEGEEIAKTRADEKGRFVLSGIPFSSENYILVAQKEDINLKKILSGFSENMDGEILHSGSTAIARLVEWEMEKALPTGTSLALGTQKMDQKGTSVVDKNFSEPDFSVDVKTLVNFLNNAFRDGSSLLSRLAKVSQKILEAQVGLKTQNSKLKTDSTTDEILDKLLEPNFDGKVAVQGNLVDTAINPEEIQGILGLVGAANEAIVSSNLSHFVPDASSSMTRASTEILSAAVLIDGADSQVSPVQVEAVVKTANLLKSSIKSRVLAISAGMGEKASQHMLSSSDTIAQTISSVISNKNQKAIGAISSLADAANETAKAAGKATASKNPEAIEISLIMAEHTDLLALDFLGRVNKGKGISLEMGEGLANIVGNLSRGLNMAIDKENPSLLSPLSNASNAIKGLREKALTGDQVFLAQMSKIVDGTKEIADAVSAGDVVRATNAADGFTNAVQNILQPPTATSTTTTTTSITSTTTTTTTTTTIPPLGGGGGGGAVATTTIPDDNIAPYLVSLALVGDIQNPNIRMEFNEAVRLIDPGKVAITSLREPTPSSSPLNPGSSNPNYPDKGSPSGNFEFIYDHINNCMPTDKTIIAIGDPPTVISGSSPCEDGQHRLRYKVASFSLGDWGLEVATGEPPSTYMLSNKAVQDRISSTIWNVKVALSESRDFIASSLYIPLLIRIGGEAFQEIDEAQNEKVSTDINVMLRLPMVIETRLPADFRAVFQKIEFLTDNIILKFTDNINIGNAQANFPLTWDPNNKTLQISRPQQGSVSIALPRFVDLSALVGRSFGELDLFIKAIFR